jgi:protein O-GlcNAc transferase
MTNPSRRSAKIDDLIQQALALHQQGRLGDATRLYETILRQNPRHFDALNLLGVIACQHGNFAVAVQRLGQALKVNPAYAPGHSNLGYALRELQRFDEALASCDRALALQPDLADALSNRGGALRALRRYEEALTSYDRALALQPGHAETWNARSILLCELKRPQEALAGFDRALALRPAYAEALSNRGGALRSLGRFAEALACYDRALAIRPDHAESWNNRGIVLSELGRPQAALACYERALALKPDDAESLNNRSTALCALGRHAEAIQSFERLLARKPDFDYARGEMFHARLHCCDWPDYPGHVAALEHQVAAGTPAVGPFSFLSASGSPALQLRCAMAHSKDNFGVAPAVWHGERHRHDRIRLAYVSADFRNHPVAALIAGLIEAHDRARFETIAISFGPGREDALRRRLERAFEHFIEVGERSDHEVAQLMKQAEIDIAVDLTGYTMHSRPRILALRPAPVQVAYLGFPGTMGAAHIDYLLADRIVIPQEHHAFYRESIVTLPDCYQPNDRRAISQDTPSRIAAGLPETGFVFCSFNNHFKITPPVFAVWMRLLHRVEGSVLWLSGGNDASLRNLRHEAERQGIAPDRLIFAPRVPDPADHLARHRLAGLMLDTLPFNAHTTASDALWAGLPIVTCLGSGFAGRVAASLLRGVGLPELITTNLEDYEALALGLALEPARLAEIKTKLARNRTSFPLFDTDRFRRHIESAYETMWQRDQRGEKPESFAVVPLG